LSFHRRTQSPL